MSLTIEEQELHINASRDSDMATAYCSDSTWITKMDKLVRKSPDLFKVIAENDVSKTYEFPKRLISIRSTFKTLTDEQREQSAERFRKLWETKKTTED